MNKINLPNTIPVFPINNCIIFPKTTVPLNIFEPRYIEMINDSMKSNKLIGLIQPKNSTHDQLSSILYDIGCLGKITSFKETDDARYLIELKGIIRFKIIKELKSVKQYRQCNVDFKDFEDALQNYSAVKNGKISIVLTRNIKDYKKSELAVMTPETYLRGTASS